MFNSLIWLILTTLSIMPLPVIKVDDRPAAADLARWPDRTCTNEAIRLSCNFSEHCRLRQEREPHNDWLFEAVENTDFSYNVWCILQQAQCPEYNEECGYCGNSEEWIRDQLASLRDALGYAAYYQDKCHHRSPCDGASRFF